MQLRLSPLLIPLLPVLVTVAACGGAPPLTQLADGFERHATLTSVEPNGGARSDVYVAVITFAPGDDHRLEASRERDQYLVVREGALELHTPTASDAVSIAAGEIVHVPPGATAATVVAAGEAECKAILATVVCGDATFACEGTEYAPEQALDLDDTHGAFTHVHRRDARSVLRVARDTMEVEVVVEGESGAARATSFDYLDGNPDMQVPQHVHDTSMEILFVESGSGVMHLAGREISVTPGCLFVIPRGTTHDFRAAGPDRFRALQLYAPSGPEQRFRRPPM